MIRNECFYFQRKSQNVETPNGAAESEAQIPPDWPSVANKHTEFSPPPHPSRNKSTCGHFVNVNKDFICPPFAPPPEQQNTTLTPAAPLLQHLLVTMETKETEQQRPSPGQPATHSLFLFI